MGGFITERDFDAAEREFPGIQRLYERLSHKPRTFLELMWSYDRMRDAPSDTASPARALGAGPTPA
jgi:hypothetical protein